MRTFTIDVMVDEMPYKALVLVSDANTECPTIHIYEELISEWGEGTCSATNINGDVEDLYDAAFLEACRQEEEDEYETEQASKTGF